MTYEYACSSCSHEWEAEQSIKDEPLKECPACHKATARRQISRGVGFILKGGGWYSDLYSSGSNKAEGSADKGADASSGSEAGKGKEATGASKPEAGASKPDASSKTEKADAGASKPDAGASKADTTSSIKKSAA